MARIQSFETDLADRLEAAAARRAGKDAVAVVAEARRLEDEARAAYERAAKRRLVPEIVTWHAPLRDFWCCVQSNAQAVTSQGGSPEWVAKHYRDALEIFTDWAECSDGELRRAYLDHTIRVRRADPNAPPPAPPKVKTDADKRASARNWLRARQAEGWSFRLDATGKVSAKPPGPTVSPVAVEGVRTMIRHSGEALAAVLAQPAEPVGFVGA